MTNSYAKAYTEVLEILSHFSKEEYSKIPQEKINFYKSNMEKNYEYSINPNIDLSKQYISKEANAILLSIFRDYFANDRQRKTLNNLLSQNQEKLENIIEAGRYTATAKNTQSNQFIVIQNDIEELKSKYKPYTFNNIENIIDTEKQSSIQIDQKINCAHYPHFIATNKNIAKLEFLK